MCTTFRPVPGDAAIAPAFLVLVVLLAGCGGSASPVPRVERELHRTALAQPRSQAPDAPLPISLPRPAPDATLKPDDWFEDVTDRTGIRFAYRDGQEAAQYTLLETVGGGVAAFDYDGDGSLDLYFPGGGRLAVEEAHGAPILQVAGRPSALYRNLGEFRFEEVTEAAGLKDDALYTHGCAVGDFDRDGRPDLFVTGYRGCRLYRNQGDGTFEDVTQQAGIRCDKWAASAAWADIDRDGWLDLYVTTYAKWEPKAGERFITPEGYRDVSGVTDYAGERDCLFRNRGDGTFEDLSEQAGLVPANRGMGVVAADFDDDGWIDFYVVNDVEENQLYFGGESLPLVERAALAGAALSSNGERDGSMGVDAGDYDGDGRIDLWYTNYSHQDDVLLWNAGERTFENRTEMSGTFGTNRNWVGWGTFFLDVDGDGWLDLVAANGHTRYKAVESEYDQPALLFRNDRGRKFVDVSEQAGAYFRQRHPGRGLAYADLDNDGAPDLIAVHQNDPVTVLKNRRTPAGWVRLQLVGTRSNTDAVGAKVVVTSGNRSTTRWVLGGGSYLSHSDRRILVTVTPAQPVKALVHWPAGAREAFSSLAPGKTHRLVEGEGAAK